MEIRGFECVNFPDSAPGNLRISASGNRRTCIVEDDYAGEYRESGNPADGEPPTGIRLRDRDLFRGDLFDRGAVDHQRAVADTDLYGVAVLDTAFEDHGRQRVLQVALNHPL